jgi:hypothetical protein
MAGESGTLEKLRILAYEKPDYSAKFKEEFEAYINPNEITLSYEVEYFSKQAPGTTGSPMTFSKVKPGETSLTFFIDGTGANGHPANVQEEIELFQTVTGYSGEIHRPHYLKLMWGKLQIKRCILKSASIAYKLFTSNGVPLRAVITANFADNIDDKTRVAVAQDQSSDLTHVRLIKAGDNLPTLCYEIYGDPGYYLKVARANRLDNFRRLTSGMKIFFPPLEK